MGEGTFTGRLHHLASSQRAIPFALSGPIHIDGPYGGEYLSDFVDHDLVILIAGGIGITPAHSILRTLASGCGSMGRVAVSLLSFEHRKTRAKLRTKATTMH